MAPHSVEIWKKGRTPDDGPPDLHRRNIPDNQHMSLQIRGGGRVSTVMNTKERKENPALDAFDCLEAVFTSNLAPIEMHISKGPVPRGYVSAEIAAIIKDNFIRVTGWFSDFTVSPSMKEKPLFSSKK